MNLYYLFFIRKLGFHDAIANYIFEVNIIPQGLQNEVIHTDHPQNNPAVELAIVCDNDVLSHLDQLVSALPLTHIII